MWTAVSQITHLQHKIEKWLVRRVGQSLISDTNFEKKALFGRGVGGVAAHLVTN